MLAKGDCLPNRKNEKALERNSKLWDLKLLNSVMVTQRNNFKKLKKKSLTVFSSGFNFKIKFITKHITLIVYFIAKASDFHSYPFTSFILPKSCK